MNTTPAVTADELSAASSNAGRRRAGRRGYGLMEMVVAIGLIIVVLGSATRLLIGAVRSAHADSVTQADTAAVDAAVSALRRDAERATNVDYGGDTLTLAADGPTWRVDGRELVRTAGGRVTRFGPLPETPTLSAGGGVARLSIGPAAWAIRPIVEGGGR